jgi:hypothetical protein
MSRPTSDAIIESLLTFAYASIGHCYVFGGAPGPNGQGCWDCSSFQNYNFGVVNGLAIPGYPPGTFDATTHGPSSLTWLGSVGTVVGTVDRADAQAGDLACWLTHIGLFIDNQYMISAENPTDGTQKGFVDGFIPGEPLTVLRHSALGPGGINFPVPVIGSGTDYSAITRDVAQLAIGLVKSGEVLDRVGTRGWRP